MSIIPFLCPLVEGMLAYRNTYYRLPTLFSPDSVFAKVPLECRFILKWAKSVPQKVQAIPTHPLNEELQPLLDRLHIRKDLHIIEQVTMSFFAAMGTNFFTGGDAVIWMLPGSYAVDKDSASWVMKHELAHIKNNDSCTMPLLPAICALGVAILTRGWLSVLPATLITVSTQFAVHSLFQQYRESAADDFAIAESSNEELMGGKRMLICIQNVTIDAETRSGRTLRTPSTGEIKHNFTHPSTASRIAKIERALQERGRGSALSEEDMLKIQQQTKLMVDSYSGIADAFRPK